jgi:aminopeptidase N
MTRLCKSAVDDDSLEPKGHGRFPLNAHRLDNRETPNILGISGSGMDIKQSPPAMSRFQAATLIALTALFAAAQVYAQTPAAVQPGGAAAPGQAAATQTPGHAAAAAATGQGAGAPAPDQGAGAAPMERLPDSVVPLHYDLHLYPNAVNLTFAGEVHIDVQVKAPAAEIVLNAKELVLDEVSMDGGPRGTVTLDTKLEQARLRFAGSVAPGEHSLNIRYHGTIVQNTLGFFAMDYESSSGKHRTLATNFEPASERMLMPSWDEPGLKATFRVTVDAPADRMAVGNMPIESESPLPNGMKRVRFAQTPKMATYLLFLAIGDFERVSASVDGLQVGVVVAKGDAGRGAYALSQAVRLMHYYNEYFGVHFPLPKLDLVAAPGEIDGGSMENWGAILYSQKHILFDQKNSTAKDRQLVFEVVAHEMAHQWFGDLVTMSWWDNLWLNEGFARWMQTKAADDLNPQWDTGLQASSIVEQGMRADAKPSTHPIEQRVASAAEAELAFDEITYDKGASVIGMLESYVGADRFRDGVRSYMRAHAFGNTVSADLWQALQAAAGKPVQGIAEDFTRRPGLPLVSVGLELEQSGGRAQLAQSRFFEAHREGSAEAPERPWRLPITVESLGDKAPSAMVLDTEHGKISFSGAPPAIVNVGRKSYTRVRYEPQVFAALTAHLESLAPIDQIGMLQDSWALGTSEYAPITHVLSVIDALPLKANPVVWVRAVAVLEAIDDLYGGLPGQAAYREWARSRLEPSAKLLGWSQAPGQTESANLLRARLLVALGRFGDLGVIAEARRRDAAASADPAAESPEVRQIARKIVAYNADAAAFDRLIGRLHATHDPLEKQDLLEALTSVADPALAGRLLEVIGGPDIPAGMMPGLLIEVGEEHPDLTWSFAMARVDTPGYVLDRSTRMQVMPELPARSADVHRAEELRAYAAAHLPAAASREVEGTVAQIDLNARVRSVGLPRIDEWLKKQHEAARP